MLQQGQKKNFELNQVKGYKSQANQKLDSLDLWANSVMRIPLDFYTDS